MPNGTDNQSESNLALSQSMPIAWRRIDEMDGLLLDSIMYDNEALLGNQHWVETFEHSLYDEVPRGDREDVLEVRLDLLISLVGIWMRRQVSPPPSMPVTLDEVMLRWECPEVPKQGEQLLVDLYLVPRFPMPLVLPCEVIGVEPIADSENWRTITRLLHLSERTRQGISRAIFSCHRRLLRERRESRKNEDDNPGSF